MLGLKLKRRQKVSTLPFPGEWAAIVLRNVPYYSRLPAADRSELEGHIQVFLSEKRFEGCAGLAVTEEIRVTIAAHACTLLLHRNADYYPRLTTVLVYPHAFVVQRYQPGPGGQPVEAEQILAGESWHQGIVILAWDEVQHAAIDIHDGHNVALHEFAHQLDEEDGLANGVPRLPQRAMYTAWARVLGRDYTQLISSTEAGCGTLMDAYGATTPAEFFAVATECFFETPAALRAQHPDLYRELQGYYRQDPAALFPAPP